MNPLRLVRARPSSRVENLPDGALLHLLRDHRTVDTIRLGKNHVHGLITHADGTWTDLGVSENLLTTVGRTLAHQALGNVAMKDGVVTASSATSATPSGGGLTADQYKGWRVFMPVTGLTTAPVYGNIGSNSTTVLTVDGWWVGTADTMTGATPASTSGYFIIPTCLPRFMGITADSGAASAGSTTLTSEQTANGLARVKGVTSYTAGNATETIVGNWSPSNTVANLHRIGLFTAANTTAAGVLVFESVLNADASVVSGDTLQVTDTITIS